MFLNEATRFEMASD
jgi:hypothetical protein